MAVQSSTNAYIPTTTVQTYLTQHSPSNIVSFTVEVEPGWSVYVEESGNPNGIPAVFVHGGPGSKFRDTDHRWFDPFKYRIILFQQRGTHNCTPSARNLDQPASTFKDVTIDTLGEDLEVLRKYLNIDTWLVFGGSWGSTLSLYYAQKYPKVCLGLVLSGIFLSNEDELEEFFIEEHLNDRVDKWDRTTLNRLYEYAQSQGIPTTAKKMCETYRTLIVENNDPKAARIWRAFENYIDNPESEEQRTRVLSDDLEANPDEWSTGIWETQLIHHMLENKIDLMNIDRIKGIKDVPIKIVQGKKDTICPSEVAINLVQKMQTVGCDVNLSIIDEGCHSPYSHAGMVDALVKATNEFASCRTQNYTQTS